MRIFLLALLIGCASTEREIIPQQPLLNQRLAPRPGFKGKLTNQFCVELDEKNPKICKKSSIIEYDMNDPNVRLSLVELEFICNVAGKRYRISIDSPSLISTKYMKKLFSKKAVNEYINFNDQYDRLLNANTFCAAKNSILGQSMFL